MVDATPAVQTTQEPPRVEAFEKSPHWEWVPALGDYVRFVEYVTSTGAKAVRNVYKAVHAITNPDAVLKISTDGQVQVESQ